MKAKNAVKQFQFFAPLNFITEEKLPPGQIFEPIGDHLELADRAYLIGKWLE
jgi:hypothetical protein